MQLKTKVRELEKQSIENLRLKKEFAKELEERQRLIDLLKFKCEGQD